MSDNFIKERLLSILNSEKTINLLKGKYNNIPITKSIPLLNTLIRDVFIDEKDVRIIDYDSNKTNDIIINNDKILIRLNSLDYRCKRINFKYFNYIKDEDFLIEEVIDQVNFSLDSYSYFFFNKR